MYRSLSTRPSSWQPLTLRLPFLSLIVLISIFLIVALQYLHTKNLQNNGLLFAPEIRNLPLSQTFVLLYLPTIISVLYGLAWTWIDLDVRRLEPWFQLSRAGGALGRNSLLLRYPVEFFASVPYRALRNKHWTVFIASIATVLALWGLTPVQAGVFTTRSVTVNEQVVFGRSQAYIRIQDQDAGLEAVAVQSASSIIWLNETLPLYMTPDFVVAPFAPIDVIETRSTPDLALDFMADNSESWTSMTTKYSVDVECETPTYYGDLTTQPNINSSWGCTFFVPMPISGFHDQDTQIYDSLYFGYYNVDGTVDYYLSNGGCPKDESHTFIAQWSKLAVGSNSWVNMTTEEKRKNIDITTRWCRPRYYQQDVNATLTFAATGKRLTVVDMGPRQDIPSDLLNIAQFEIAMSEGQQTPGLRSSFPSVMWPNQAGYLLDTGLNVNYLPRMTPFAIGAYQRPMDDYLDPAVLDASYQAAFRMLFSRRVSEILLPVSQNVSRTSAGGVGNRQIATQAIVMNSAFTYITETLLGLLAVLAVALAVTHHQRTSLLRADPSALSHMMEIAANDDGMLQLLAPCDRTNSKDLDVALTDAKFMLRADHTASTGPSLVMLRGRHDDTKLLASGQDNLDSSLQGVLPFEFRRSTFAGFVLLQLAILISSYILFHQSRLRNGLPLPSNSQFIRSLLESYIPIAIGALIEPIWLVLNRHLCALQPFESLRKGRQSAPNTLDLRYASLPPQMVISQALRRKHFLLAFICTMPLLANLLAVALNGLLFENLGWNVESRGFALPYKLQFVALNGSADPFVRAGVAGTSNLQAFYIATSNITRNTSMPAWADGKYFYHPFDRPSAGSAEAPQQFRATTAVIGSNVSCMTMDAKLSLALGGFQYSDGSNLAFSAFSNLTINYQDSATDTVYQCVPRNAKNFSPSINFAKNYQGKAALEFNVVMGGSNVSSDAETRFCQSIVVASWIRAEVSRITVGNETFGKTNTSMDILDWNATMIACRPKLSYGHADVTVDSQGLIIEVHNVTTSDTAPTGLFETSNITDLDLLGQANQFLVDPGLVWHADRNPSDFTNYLIAKAYDYDSIFDPASPSPDFEVTSERYSRMYDKLFTIFMARNKGRLFLPNDSTLSETTGNNATIRSSPEQTLRGTISTRASRIYLSYTFFLITEILLGLYIIATIILYVSRPWRVLARMPDTPASIIAYFAASKAVRDFRTPINQEQSESSSSSESCSMVGRDEVKGLQVNVEVRELNEERVRREETLYGFGSFFDKGGILRVGIEKEPFIRLLLLANGQDLENGGQATSRRALGFEFFRKRKRTYTVQNLLDEN